MNCPSPRLVAPFATACALLLLSACATLGASDAGIRRIPTDAESRYGVYAGQPIDRFTAFDIDSWEALSDRQLVLWTGVNEAFLITLWETCEDLRFVDRIGVSRTGASVSRFDRIRYEGRSCPISEIRPIDIRQMRADRRAERERERVARPAG